MNGFTLTETTIALGIIGICFVGLLGSLSWSLTSVEWAREFGRATQLMEEKLDTLRLYSWDQINTPGYMVIAPGASLTIYVGGKFTVSGGAGVHLDEALNGSERYVVNSWSEWSYTEL